MGGEPMLYNCSMFFDDDNQTERQFYVQALSVKDLLLKISKECGGDHHDVAKFKALTFVKMGVVIK